MRRTRTLSLDGGFTLIEMLVAIFVLLVGVLGVVALVDGANRTTSSNRAREGATNLTRELIEDARSVPYGSLDTSTLASTIASLSGGVVQAGGTVNFTRRGTTYSVTPTLCYVDDPKDGYGSHAGATFCNANTDTRDSFPRDYKRFTSVTTWTGARGAGTSRQSAVINDPGSSFAPQITAFSMTSPTACTGNPPCAQVDAGAVSSASFSATTSVPASKVSWYVNDTLMGTAAGSGTGPWTFTWPLNLVVTGTYTVSVRANSGKDGAVRNIVVPVKEFGVGAPTSPFGGLNQLWTNVAELTWTPVSASVLGYEVQRLVGGVWADVTCYDETGVVAASPRPTGSTCLDKSAAGATQYRIYTVFLFGTTPTRSVSTANVTIASNVRPCPPASVTLNTSTDTVSWTTPVAGGGCDATRIKAYRVYRYAAPNGSGTLPAGFSLALSNRMFKTSDASVHQWRDATRTNKMFYWVSAIDNLNAESVVVGPVH